VAKKRISLPPGEGEEAHAEVKVMD